MPRSETRRQRSINNIVTVREHFDAIKCAWFSIRMGKCFFAALVCVFLSSPSLLRAQSYQTRVASATNSTPSNAQCDAAKAESQKQSAESSKQQPSDAAPAGVEDQEISQGGSDTTKRNLRLPASATSDSAADPQTPQCKGKDDDAEHWRPKEPSMSANPAASSEVKATAPLVSLQDGKITINSRDAKLGEILEAIERLTGITVDIPPAGADERIFDNVGPMLVREALVKLLDGTKFNYIIVSSAQDPQAVKKLILSTQTNTPPITASTPSPQNTEEASGPALYGGSGYNNDTTASNDPPPTPQPIETPAAAKAALGLPANFNLQQAAAAAGKTPGQMLDELQKRQIQQLDDQLSQNPPAQQ